MRTAILTAAAALTLTSAALAQVTTATAPATTQAITPATAASTTPATAATAPTTTKATAPATLPATKTVTSQPAPNFKEVDRVAWVVGFHETGALAAPFIKQQLGSAITQMRYSRYLSIVMVTEEVIDITPKGGYIRALGDDKTAVLAKIETSKPSGDRTKDAPYLVAVTKVLALDKPPELIFLMVDSPVSDETAEAISAANKKGTFITVISVLPPEGADLEPLKKIAEANKGKFRVLTEKEIAPPVTTAPATASSSAPTTTTAPASSPATTSAPTTIPATTTAPSTAP